MNFFVDFEASQYTQEIISIGCVAENGQTFYRLVNTKHRIGNFVSELTGLTQEDIAGAPSPDVVFTQFYNWVLEQCGNASVQFFCYGNVDTTFAGRTLKNIHRSFSAQCILSLIQINMIDYADFVKAYFGLTKHISLLKVAQFYSPNETLIQTHNALDDALMLKFVYDNIQQGVPLDIVPFPEYMLQVERRNADGELEETYYGFPAAIKWVLNRQGMAAGTNSNKIANKIKNASDQKKAYCGFYWTVGNI